MSRVKLDLPGKFHYSTELQISVGLINYAGHMGNDAALTLIHEARMRFLKSLGFSELDAGGRGIILTDAILVFKAEAFWNDIVATDIAVSDFNKYGCDFYYRIRRQTDDRDILHAKTGILFFDYESRKPARVPSAFLTALGMETKEP